MRRFFKYLFKTLLSFVFLLLFIVFLLYIPGIQGFIKNKAVEYATERLGMEISIEKFSIRFPLGVVIDRVFVGKTTADTMLYAGKIVVDVNVPELFRRKIAVKEIALDQIKFAFDNDTTGMHIRVRLDRLMLGADRVNLREKRIDLRSIQLNGGDVKLIIGENPAADTIARKAFDWTFALDKLTFENVNFEMNSPSLPLLLAGVGKGEIISGEVSIGSQYVRVDSLGVQQGFCRMKLQSGGTVKKTRKTNEPTSLWTVRAGTVTMQDNAFALGFEQDHKLNLNLSGIAIRLDSVYNRGLTVKADLKQLQVVDQGGVSIQKMQAGIHLDSTSCQVANVFIQTANSMIQLDATTNTSVTGLMKDVPLYVTLKADVGIGDLIDMPFIRDKKWLEKIRKKQVNINTQVIVTSNDLSLTQLSVTLPGAFKITGKGRVQAYQDIKRTFGNIALKGDLENMTFVNSFLKGKVNIPKDISFACSLNADKGVWTPDLKIRQGQGTLSVTGKYAVADKSYQANVEFDRFRLDRFLPADSLGILTATIGLKGNGLAWGSIEAGLAANIKQFAYRRHDYEGISLTAALHKKALKGKIVSEDKAALLHLEIEADSVDREYQAKVNGTVKMLDLYALNLSATEFATSFDLHIKGASASNKKLSLQVVVDSVGLTTGLTRRKLGGVALNMDSDAGHTRIDMVSGDFRLEFQGDTAVQDLSGEFGRAAKEIQSQLRSGQVDIEKISHVLPDFQLKANVAENNIISRYLQSERAGFKKVNLQMSNRVDGIMLHAELLTPYFRGTQFDTLIFDARQNQQKLNYDLSIFNPSGGGIEDIHFIRLNGYLQRDLLNLAIRQQNAANEIGFDVGMNLTFGKDSLSLSLFPTMPIMGFSRWLVNPGNYITYANRKITANLKISYENKWVIFQSLGDEGDKKDRLKFDVSGIDLGNISKQIPFIPPMEGILLANMLLYSEGKQVVADGVFGINEFYYKNARVGNVELDLNYKLDSTYTAHRVDFALHLDSVRRALIQGDFSTSLDKHLQVDVDIPSFPLRVVDAFVPDNIIKLDGDLQGMLRFRGTLDKPLIDGGIVFRKTSALIIPLGTTFGVDSNRIAINDSKIVFNKFYFLAPNKRELFLNGNVLLSPLSRVTTDLTLSANNFQVVNVKQNPNSLVYGKAYVDLGVTIQGPVDALKVNGNVNLLNNTVIDYVFRNADPQLVDKSVDLVRFVSFRDTALNVRDLLTNRIKADNFSMKLFVEIGNAVRVTINLSEDGENRAVISGGGNLIYSMNQEGTNSLIGKYTLTSGTVRYNIPIVAEKTFNIQSGSYVEWTGDLANPSLNITASEAIKASVTDDNQNSRLVNFNAIIRIQGNVQRPEITFDLSAPNDMTIQNQLATYSPEERTKQALNLLINNTYTGPGASGSGGGANNTLNNFIEKELNQWSRKNLKNVGLTFGIDSYNQLLSTGQEVTHTDYSYQFSKQLFNDKVNVKIGGRITDSEVAGDLGQNLVDDIAIEYIFSKNRNFFLKVFRHSDYESVLEGEVTQTGVGIVMRKSFRKLKDLFIPKSKRKDIP